MTIADINLLFIWRWAYVLYVFCSVLMLCVVLQLPHRTGLRCFYCQMSERVQNKDVDTSRQTDTEVFVFYPPPPRVSEEQAPHRPLPSLKQTLINRSFWVQSISFRQYSKRNDARNKQDSVVHIWILTYDAKWSMRSCAVLWIKSWLVCLYSQYSIILSALLRFKMVNA